MSNYVILHHAHHPDEDLYRIIFARQEQYENEDNEIETVLFDAQEVVWHAPDDHWQGKSESAIAEEQRAMVRDILAKRERESEEAMKRAAEAAAAIKHFGSAGEEL